MEFASWGCCREVRTLILTGEARPRFSQDLTAFGSLCWWESNPPIDSAYLSAIEVSGLRTPAAHSQWSKLAQTRT